MVVINKQNLANRITNIGYAGKSKCDPKRLRIGFDFDDGEVINRIYITDPKYKVLVGFPEAETWIAVNYGEVLNELIKI